MSCCVLLCFVLGLLSLFFRQVLSNNISVVIDELLVKDVVPLFLHLFLLPERHPSLQIAVQVILFLLLISSYGFDSLSRGFVDEQYYFFLLISACSDTWCFKNYCMILRILTKWFWHSGVLCFIKLYPCWVTKIVLLFCFQPFKMHLLLYLPPTRIWLPVMPTQRLYVSQW